jgi:outer membrane receptor for ferrienterochelin and colicins
MKRVLVLLLCPMLIFANETITLSRLEPFESENFPELEQKIQGKLEEDLKNNSYTVNLLNSRGREALSESKSKGAKIHIGGYYKKKPKLPLEIYLQVYSVENGTVIDAVSSSLRIDAESGIEFAPDELRTLDEDKISEISRKLATQIRTNPERKEQPQNINDELLNKRIARSIDFPISQTGRQKDAITKDTFELLGSQEVETASRSKESILDAPATIMVITEEEIRQRGYTSLTEILENIPGMDISFSNSLPYTTPYMRGYRTDSGQKILFMIDSKPQNDIWAQSVRISRQYPITAIKKIEILYGPSSVVYGPNATQGIINVITKSGQELKKDGTTTAISLQHGSFNTNAFDATATGRNGEFTYALSGKYFKSNEPDLGNRVQNSYVNNFYYGFRPIWGPVLDADFNGKKFGKYRDPSLEQGILANINYKGLKLGIIYDKVEGGAGVAYTGDQVQPNGNFGDESTTIYAEYEKNIGKKFRSFTQVYQRTFTRKGTWTESIPNPTEETIYDEEGNEIETISNPYESLVSNTYWQAVNKMYQVNQIFDYKFNQFFKLSTGLNFTNRKLSRNYDVPGYYGAFNSILVDDFDKYPNGFNVVSSSSTDPLPVTPIPTERQHPMNTASIQDTGGYLLGTIDYNKFRFNLGVRYDKNSDYGSTVNPRATMIYKHTPTQAWKLTYGEAFQEPTALQIYGDSGGANYVTGIAGSVANTNLKPEKMRSGEIIWILQSKTFYNEISSFYNKYDRVIEQDFLSVYGKRIYGTEWKLTKFFPNIIPASGKISTFFNYTFTESWNSVTYDSETLSYRNGSTAFGKYEKVYDEVIYPELEVPLPRNRKYYSAGDIAKHKLNVGFNLPIFTSFNVNMRGSYVGQRGLYSTNPLRQEGIKTDPYFLWHGTFSYLFENYGVLSFKVFNMFNQFYMHPGVEFAGGGNRYWERSADYRNSLMPQPGRYFLINLTLTF